LPGNLHGRCVCISRALNRKRTDGKVLDDGWERTKFTLDEKKLSWYPIHTEIVANNTGRMITTIVTEEKAGEIELEDADICFHDKKKSGHDNCFQISSRNCSVYVYAESLRDAEVWLHILQQRMHTKFKKKEDDKWMAVQSERLHRTKGHRPWAAECITYSKANQLAEFRRDDDTAPPPPMEALVLNARASAYRARQPACIFTGKDRGPWQQQRATMSITAPFLTLGDRACEAAYWENKRIQHVQTQ